MYDVSLVRACERLRSRGLSLLTVGLFALLLLTAFSSAAQAAAPEAPGETFPVSVDASGKWADGEGATPYAPVSISEDGRFVAFQSASTNLGEAGAAGVGEGFVKNLETGAVTLASSADGADGDPADAPGVTTFALSGNGRYVLFTSAATNLGTPLPGEEAGEQHVYRRDLRTGETTLVDRVSGTEGAILSRGAGATSISADGRYVAFIANVANLEDPSGDHTETTNAVAYVRDMQSGTTAAISRASGATGALADKAAEWASLSPDGRYVAFSSRADNLVPGVDEGVWEQVYLRDTETNTTTLLSQNALGEPGDRSSSAPAVSGGDGCYIQFSSIAYNLLEPSPLEVSGQQVYVADRCASPTTVDLVSKDASHPIAAFGSAGYAASGVSADGDEALFSGELTGSDGWHLYLRDRGGEATRALDRASGEAPLGDAEAQEYAISANGCRVAFASAATNLFGSGPPIGPGNEEPTQVYVRQLKRCAPEPTGVNVRIEGRVETLFEGTVPTTIHKIRAASDLEERACDGINPLDPGNVIPGVTPTLASAEAMASIGKGFDGEWYDGYGDYFIDRWGPDDQDPSAGAYWGILVNEVFSNVGGCQYQLDEDDQVLWAYDAFQGRPSLALFPEEAHYTSGPRPTTATARVGIPFPVEVVSYADDTENVPREVPSREGSSGYAGAEVAPVTTNAKGFQRVETSSPETVLTNGAGKVTVVFTTPGTHRIKATVGTPGAESAIRSNGIEVEVLPAESKPVEESKPGDKPAPVASPAGPPAPSPARVGKPTLDRGQLSNGRLKIDWDVLDPGAGVMRWWIEAKPLHKPGAHFTARASGTGQTAAAIKLAPGSYRLRFRLTDKSGHTTKFALDTVTVPGEGPR